MEHSYMREKSLFGHNLWKDNARLVSSIVYDIMKTTRHRYHYLLRRLERDLADIIQNKICKNLLKTDSKKCWTAIRRLNGSKQVTSETVK